MTRVAVATTSAIAADAAREVAEAGGNAVDCALATAMMSMNTEPGVCALAGGAYVTVWAPGHDPVLLVHLGTELLLMILVGTSLAGALITWLFRIETAGVNLEEIGR
mgnify:CR=1 FL=1